MNQVYAVVEFFEGEARISAMYAKYEDAVKGAQDLAAYAGLIKDETFEDTWNDAEGYDYVTVEAHDVL